MIQKSLGGRRTMSCNVHKHILDVILPEEAERGSEYSDSSMPPWVLHVEDDVQFSAALKTRLESHGVAVIRAFDGADGVQNAVKYPADAIILDIEMPNIAGDEVLRLLKETESTKHIPVIVLSCRKERNFQQRMLDMGATAYLTKPLEFPQLQKELAKHIDILASPQI